MNEIRFCLANLIYGIFSNIWMKPAGHVALLTSSNLLKMFKSFIQDKRLYSLIISCTNVAGLVFDILEWKVNNKVLQNTRTLYWTLMLQHRYSSNLSWFHGKTRYMTRFMWLWDPRLLLHDVLGAWFSGKTSARVWCWKSNCWDSFLGVYQIHRQKDYIRLLGVQSRKQSAFRKRIQKTEKKKTDWESSCLKRIQTPLDTKR